MDHYPFTHAMLTHTGRVRSGNEDTVCASPEDGVFVVCDGMGGAAAGEVASRLAANTFVKALHSVPAPGNALRRATPDVRLGAAVVLANQAVYRAARRSAELQGMGTTLVGLLLELTNNPADAPSLTLVHVGDSRCYLFRQGELVLLTHDHSLVEEQVRLGEMTASEAATHPMRNIITRAVGSGPEVQPEITQLSPLPGDIYLLASDGLTRDLNETQIAQSFSRAVNKSLDGRPDLSSLCQTLVDEANDAGGGDNISVLLLQVA